MCCSRGLEVLISSQLLDIEQAAALKKLESEALAEAKKVEVAALALAVAQEAGLSPASGSPVLRPSTPAAQARD